MAEVDEILSHVRQELAYLYIVSIMCADVMATQEARASVTIIITTSNLNNSNRKMSAYIDAFRTTFINT